MSREIEQVLKWARRYGLALCCVIAPIVLALGPFGVVLGLFMPDTPDMREIPSVYAPAQPKPIANDKAEAKSASSPSSAAEQATPDPALFLIGLQYQGKVRYVTASAFIYLISAAVLAFSFVIVYRRFKWKCLLASFTVVLVLDCIVTFILSTLYGHRLLYGRELVVDKVLKAAESFPTIKQPSGTSLITSSKVLCLISVNTFVGLVAVGMLLMALAVLSIPGGLSKLDCTELELRTELNLRRNCLRVALGLGSALFVISVLANKALVGWALSLVSDSQRLALQPVADVVTLQLGTMGTIAIIAAFAPAITAWWLDKELYRDKFRNNTASGKAEPEPELEHKPHDATEPREKDAKSSEPKATDEFSFASLATISAVIAALAPLLASPFVNTLMSLFHWAGK